MDINNYTGAVTIEANGGQGGTANDGGNVGRCYGAGGGGGGGTIYFTGATPAVTVTASLGAAGPEVAREASCNPIVPSIAGGAGQIVPGYSIQTSNTIASTSCGLLLPVEMIFFRAEFENGLARLNWKVSEPEMVDRFIIERAGNTNKWTAINEQIATGNLDIYQATDALPLTHHNYYRIKIIGKNNEISYSAVQKIFVPSVSDRIIIHPNPATDRITVSGNIPLGELLLFDLNGKLLWKKKNNTAQNNMVIDITGFPSGVYMLSVGAIMKKVVIL